MSAMREEAKTLPDGMNDAVHAWVSDAFRWVGSLTAVELSAIAVALPKEKAKALAELFIGARTLARAFRGDFSKHQGD